MSNEKNLVVTVSNKELHETISCHELAAIKQLCDVFSFDAAVQQELAEINDLIEADQHEAADSRFDDFNVQLKFKERTLTVNLRCMDTFDAFISWLAAYEEEQDLYRQFCR